MPSWGKWWTRLGAALAATVLAIYVPAVAWASAGSGELVLEAARKRRSGGGGFLTALCCLFVVALIVLVVVLITRRRSGRR